jgi:hypothetical protein
VPFVIIGFGFGIGAERTRLDRYSRHRKRLDLSNLIDDLSQSNRREVNALYTIINARLLARFEPLRFVFSCDLDYTAHFLRNFVRLGA